MGQGKPHHGPPHDDALPRLGLELKLTQQPAYRGTDTDPGVTGFGETLTGQGDDATDQRFIFQHRLAYRKHGADVEHDHAKRERTLAGRYLPAGQNFNQLTRRAGGVLRRDDSYLHAVTVDDLTHRGDRFGFVVLNGDEHQTWFEDMAQHRYALGNAVRLFLHQTVIAGDIGFTFGTVDDQDFHFLAAGSQFDIGREARAAEPGNPRFVDALD